MSAEKCDHPGLHASLNILTIMSLQLYTYLFINYEKTVFTKNTFSDVMLPVGLGRLCAGSKKC